MFGLEDFGDFLTCRGVVDDEVFRPLQEEYSILAGFCACQDPSSPDSTIGQERYDLDANSLVLARDNGSVVLTQTVSRDDISSTEADEADTGRSASSSKVMIVVVRRDKTNNSLGLGMIP